MMTEQTRRTWAKPAEQLHYSNIGSRIAVHKVNGIEVFLPVIEGQQYEARIPTQKGSVKIIAPLSVMIAALEQCNSEIKRES